MADFIFNIAKGRIVEFYNRVESSDPTNAAFVLVPIETTDIESDATLKDYDDLNALLGAANNEQTEMGRKTLTDADLAALPAPDDANDRYDLDLPDVTWTGATGNAISKLLLCYDSDTTGGTDANILPCVAYDFVATPDGSDIVAQVNAAGFFRAS